MAEIGNNSEAQIEELAEKQRKALVEKTICKEKLKEATKIHESIMYVQLPTLMRDLGLENVTTKNGYHVSLKDKLSCSQTDGHLTAEWFLRNGGDESKVKRALTLSVWGPEYDDLIEQMKEMCRKRGVSLGVSFTVPTVTAKSLLAKMMAVGDMEEPEGLSVTTQKFSDVTVD